MFVGRVVGNLTSTLKHDALRGRKLLWVERLEPALDAAVSDAAATGAARPGKTVLAVDTVDAGPGDRVLVLDEGNGASQVLGRPRGPIRTVIVGVVDAVERTVESPCPEAS